MKRKLKLHSEIVYIAAILILSFAVAMLTAADMGISMIVAPAYILSNKLTFLTFGQSEYVLQGLVFIAFCILMKKFRVAYLGSFVTCLVYGAVLDLWRIVIPAFNPQITPPGSMELYVRIIFFVLGVLLTSFAVALFFRTYLYPQVYDFFVKGITQRYSLNRTKFKIIFDFSMLAVGCIMTLAFFGKFVGIGIGTLIMTCINGALIGLFGRLLDRFTETVPIFRRAEEFFDLDK